MTSQGGPLVMVIMVRRLWHCFRRALQPLYYEHLTWFAYELSKLLYLSTSVCVSTFHYGTGVGGQVIDILTVSLII